MTDASTGEAVAMWTLGQATGAQRIGVTHGYTGTLVRYLGELGLDAFTMPTRYESRDSCQAATASLRCLCIAAAVAVSSTGTPYSAGRGSMQ